MKKTIKLLLVLIIFFFLTSFTDADKFVGKYGVSVSDPSRIELKINADHTFYYQDFSIPENKIVINGTWTTKKGKVYLKAINSNRKFHHIWTFDDNGQTAKSRKGLTFYILGKINI